MGRLAVQTLFLLYNKGFMALISESIKLLVGKNNFEASSWDFGVYDLGSSLIIFPFIVFPFYGKKWQSIYTEIN